MSKSHCPLLGAVQVICRLASWTLFVIHNIYSFQQENLLGKVSLANGEACIFVSFTCLREDKLLLLMVKKHDKDSHWYKTELSGQQLEVTYKLKQLMSTVINVWNHLTIYI
jgi:hypothetical protein